MEAQNEKHEVIIVFSGVVALGPPLPDATDGEYVDDGPLRGVMPASRRRKVTYRDTKGNTVTEFSRVHLPVIFASLEAVESTGRPPDDSYRKFGIWYPIRERLEVSIDGDSTPTTLVYQHDPEYGHPGKVGDPEGAVPAADPIEDIAAVPDMRLISPSRSVLRDGVFDEDATDVSAHVSIPGGTLRAGAEDKRKFGARVTYAPPSNSGSLRAVVVPQVRVTVGVATELRIDSWSLDTQEEFDPISFEITADAEIWIANLDAEDVRAIINQLIETSESHHDASGEQEADDAGGEQETPQAGREQELEDAEDEDDPSCDTDFVRYFELAAGENEEFVPCDEAPDAGERKCYTVMMTLPDGIDAKRRK
jgi:hypothetical protein